MVPIAECRLRRSEFWLCSEAVSAAGGALSRSYVVYQGRLLVRRTVSFHVQSRIQVGRLQVPGVSRVRRLERDSAKMSRFVISRFHTVVCCMCVHGG